MSDILLLFVGAVLLTWLMLILDTLRQILDALHTLAARGSTRREWVSVERKSS